MGEIDFWEVEEELEEEEQLSLKLAADKIATELEKAIKALQKEEPDWDAAKKAVEAAQESYEGYAYGYAAPEEPKLKARFEAALKAIKDEDAKRAIATLEKIVKSRAAKPKKAKKDDYAAPKREQQAGGEPEETARVRLAGTLKKERDEFVMTLITPGEANGYTWPEEVLKRDLAVFDGMTSFTNHERRDVMAARPGGRTIDDICGVYYRPMWSDEARGVQARWRSMPPKGPWVAAMIDTIIDDREQGLPVPDVGVSADVSFAHYNGRVTRLNTGHSGDIVFNAARGPGHGEAFARVANAVEVQMTGGAGVEDKEKERKLQEERAMLAAMAETVVDARISKAELPVAAAGRVRAQFASAVVIDPAKVDAAIKVEQEYLASLIEDKVVKGMGASADSERDAVQRVRLGGVTLKVGANPMERVQLTMDRWFGLTVADPADVPKLDLPQLYADLTGDVNITGRFDIAAAIERTGLANITDTTFSGVVADSINKVILDQWQVIAATGYEWWRKVVHEQDFDSIHEVEWVTYGGFGDLPELNAGQEYPEISIDKLDTSEDTGNWVKPGGIISVPKETFDKGGRTGAFKNLPRALAVAEIRNLSAKVAAIFTGNAGVGPQLADGVALFNLVSHLNLRATALSFDGWVECVQDHWLQQEQNSGKVMALAPWGILVPIQLKGEGIQILANTAEHDIADRNINPYQYAADRVIPVPEFTDPANWASFVDPKAYPSIGVGYRYGRVPMVEPEPGGAGAYGMWTQDCMRWKAWWQYTVSIINYRGLQKRNVAG